MINLSVGEIKCKIPQSWNEINLKDYSKIYSIINNNIFIEPNEDDAPTNDLQIKALDAERNLHNVKINRQVFSEFTGIEKNIINKVDGEEMSKTLNTMSNFLNSEVERKITKPENKKSFTIKNKEYFFPLTEMKTTTFGDYIEAAQLDMLAQKNEAGRFGVIAEQMAVLCREQNEVYDEQLVAKKTKIFSELKMDVVWDFLFFLTKQVNTYKKPIRTYLKTETEMTTDTQQTIGQS
tara:strand:+ start:1769 stop:2476 length:708 start_codon:yes stop_codon:yes gene_type:complete